MAEQHGDESYFDGIERWLSELSYTTNPNKTNKARNDFNFRVRDKAEEAIITLLKKHNDYGPKNISQAPGGALNGLRVRLWDKVARLNNLIDKGVTPENESLYDTFLDIANYGIIGMLVLDNMWDEQEDKGNK